MLSLSIVGKKRRKSISRYNFLQITYNSWVMDVQVSFDVVALMVVILNGNSEIGAQVNRDLGNLICLRYLFRSTAVADTTVFSQYNSQKAIVCTSKQNI